MNIDKKDYRGEWDIQDLARIKRHEALLPLVDFDFSLEWNKLRSSARYICAVGAIFSQ